MRYFRHLDYLWDHSAKDLAMMEHAARQHFIWGSITFGIGHVKGKDVTIVVKQDYNSRGIYQRHRRLVQIVHETFGRFFQGYNLTILPVVYKNFYLLFPTQEDMPKCGETFFIPCSLPGKYMCCWRVCGANYPVA